MTDATNRLDIYEKRGTQMLSTSFISKFKNEMEIEYWNEKNRSNNIRKYFEKAESIKYELTNEIKRLSNITYLYECSNKLLNITNDFYEFLKKLCDTRENGKVLTDEERAKISEKFCSLLNFKPSFANSIENPPLTIPKFVDDDLEEDIIPLSTLINEIGYMYEYASDLQNLEELKDENINNVEKLNKLIEACLVSLNFDIKDVIGE